MAIYNEDAFVFLKKLESNSVDMILTDPPYFLDKMGSGTDWKSSIETNSHIKNLNMGMKFDPENGRQFEIFMKDISKECYRVLKPGGLMLAFSFPRLYHRLATAMEDSGFEVRDSLCWIYSRSQAKAFSQSHIIRRDENLNDDLIDELKDMKTQQLKNNYEIICMGAKPREERYIDTYLKYGTGLMNTSIKVGNNKFPSNVITTDEINSTYDTLFLVEKERRDDYNNHPTVKPTKLLEHLIRLFTKEDALVVDPFMGSASTAIACINSNRRYAGSEINKEYFEIGKRRINDAMV